jgi:hypothetical protein
LGSPLRALDTSRRRAPSRAQSGVPEDCIWQQAVGMPGAGGFPLRWSRKLDAANFADLAPLLWRACAESLNLRAAPFHIIVILVCQFVRNRSGLRMRQNRRCEPRQVKKSPFCFSRFLNCYRL